MRNFIPPFARPIPENATQVFQGELFSVYQWPQTLYDGSVATFEMLRRPDTVKTIAIKDDKIIVTYQRQPRKDWFYDLPGGRNDLPNEDELTAAKRELLEETGMSFKNWKLIEVHQPFSKIDWLVYTFLATDFLGAVAPKPDAGEEIKVLELSFDKFKALADDLSARDIFIDSQFANCSSLDQLLSTPALHKY